MSNTYPQYANTTFPDSIQSLIEYLDIEQSDLALYTTYIQYIYSGNYNSAQNILAQIPNYEQKTLTAQKLNQLTDTIMAIQTLYNSTEFQSQVTQFQDTWQAIINQFSYKGLWSSTNTYQQNNIVQYASTESGDDPTAYLYLATQNISSNQNNPYDEWNNNSINPKWIQLTIRGVKGENGSGASFGFEWNNSEQYTENTIVIFENAWWVCIQENINEQPSIGSDYWELIVDVSVNTIPVQSTQPESSVQQSGELWFQIVD